MNSAFSSYIIWGEAFCWSFQRSRCETSEGSQTAEEWIISPFSFSNSKPGQSFLIIFQVFLFQLGLWNLGTSLMFYEGSKGNLAHKHVISWYFHHKAIKVPFKIVKKKFPSTFSPSIPNRVLNPLVATNESSRGSRPKTRRAQCEDVISVSL